MIDNVLSKISDFFVTQFQNFKLRNRKGVEWVGKEGLICMETSALLTIFLMLFCPVIWASLISLVLVFGKSVVDKSRGSEYESHDLICSIIGVVCGVILGAVHTAIVLL